MADPAYKVNGVTLPTPDEDPDYTIEDMHGKSWRDGAGVMHLVILRRNVHKVELKWSDMTQAELDTIMNACRKDMTGVYKFEDITDGTFQIYTGADLKYKKHRVDPKTREASYKDVSLSFIEI